MKLLAPKLLRGIAPFCSSPSGGSIHDWARFIALVGQIHEQCRQYNEGEVASYIPQLKYADPNWWALSVMTVDGRTQSWGESKQKFCLQSVSKPFTYALAINNNSAEYVHKYVGQEPSGRNFNDIFLDKYNRPHNPMINAGAIVITSMLRPDLLNYERFDYIQHQMQLFAGGNEVTFDNTTYMSEKETGHQNYALGHYLKANNCYPDDHVDLRELLNLYFMHCSIQTDTETLVVMAATLANGGVDPINRVRVVSERAVKDTLSLMFSCGMYDYSGQMAFKVGLPAKSGVSGNMILVIPNFMGIALYSTRLDPTGNTVRGVKFSEALVNSVQLHLMAAGPRCSVCNSPRRI